MLCGQAIADTVRLTLSEVRTLAMRANPDLTAARLDIDIARGDFRQASVLLRSNPTVEFFGGAASNNGPEAVIAQEVEVFGQRGARRAAGRAGIRRATAGVGNVARLTLGETDRVFYRLVSASRRTDLAGEVLDLNQRLSDVVARQLEAGEVSRLEYNLATVELGRSRARALASRRERERMAADLARLLGIPIGRTIVPVIDSGAPRDTVAGALGQRELLSLNQDSLTAVALARRPDLAEREAASQQAAAQASAAAREGLPNLSLRVMSERNAAGTEQAWRPGLGVSVPFFNRNRGTVQAQRALARQAQLERAGVAARIRIEVARSVSAHRSATEELQVLETAVLPSARENRRLLETAYREGKVGLPELLLIRNQVIDAELEYWTAWLAAWESLADLNETTGESLPADVTETPR
ncbi:MAG: TolC family protein [Gemmatimonadales bacterium]